MEILQSDVSRMHRRVLDQGYRLGLLENVGDIADWTMHYLLEIDRKLGVPPPYAPPVCCFEDNVRRRNRRK